MVVSEDSDVYVLCIALATDINSYFLSDKRNLNEDEVLGTEVVSLKIDWMHGHAAPDAVLERLSWQCKRECLQEQCPCLDNGHKCT